MKSSIVNFFYKNRIVDSHIGVFPFNIWIYFLATYLDLHIFQIIIQVKGFPLLVFGLDLNTGSNPRKLDFTFKICKFGIDTSKVYSQKCSKFVDEYFAKKKEAFKEFKETLTKPELEKAEKYYELH
jgi:hypothetical protein